MSVLPNEPLSAQPTVDAVETAEALIDRTGSLRQLKLWGLIITLGLASAGVAVLWGAVQSVFLALQVQRIDPNGAVGGLSLIVGIGAIAAMLGAPIAGTLSDRTRTRFGGRAPWILFGAVASLALTVLMAFGTSIPMLVTYWFLMQLATNFVFTPISAHIPERVPLIRRGAFSAVMGTMQLIGSLGGQTIGATFSNQIVVGYVLVGMVVLVTAVLFVAVNRRSNIGVPKPPLNVGAILRTFWVNPVKHPNFAWAFTGRFLLMVGYFPLTAYTLYILQSYVGLGKDAVAVVPQVGLAGLLGTLIGTPISGFIVDRIKRTKPLIVVASLFLIVAFVVPMAWPTVPGMLVFSFLSGLGLGAYLSVDYVLITQVLPSADEVGKDLGIINITTTLPQTIGVALGGVIVTVFSGYLALFPIAIVFVIVGALCLFAIRGVR